MKTKFSMKALTFALTTTIAMTANATNDHPLAEYLARPGATVTLPVSQTQQGFSPELIKGAFDSFDSFHAQMGGDHTLYYMTNMSSVMRTDLVNPHPVQKTLNRNIQKELGSIVVNTKSKGDVTLDEYVADPLFRTQGVIMIHKGEVVYEAYPGMSQTDVHLWMSAGKTITGTIVAMLVEEGKVDTSKPISHYLKNLKGTHWEDVTVLNLLNHTSGLDHEESTANILKPDSVFVRFAKSALGNTDRDQSIEVWTDVFRDVQPLPNEKQGDHFRYSSLNTMVLGLMIQELEGKRYSDVVNERVWGKLGARMPLAIHLTPTGDPLNMGIMSSSLEDFAKYATLFTPSWNKVAHEQVVTPGIIAQMQGSGDPAAFKGSDKEGAAISMFSEPADRAGYQLDFIFADGGMYKHGNSGQGIYIDPERDFAAVYFSSNPYVPPYGEIKTPTYFRKVAEHLTSQ